LTKSESDLFVVGVLVRRRRTVNSQVLHTHLDVSTAAEERLKDITRRELLAVDELLQPRRDGNSFEEGDLASERWWETGEVVGKVVGMQRAEEDTRDGGEREVQEKEFCVGAEKIGMYSSCCKERGTYGRSLLPSLLPRRKERQGDRVQRKKRILGEKRQGMGR
jgi:hypothetical protein